MIRAIESHKGNKGIRSAISKHRSQKLPGCQSIFPSNTEIAARPLSVPRTLDISINFDSRTPKEFRRSSQLGLGIERNGERRCLLILPDQPKSKTAIHCHCLRPAKLLEASRVGECTIKAPYISNEYGALVYIHRHPESYSPSENSQDSYDQERQ